MKRKNMPGGGCCDTATNCEEACSGEPSIHNFKILDSLDGYLTGIVSVVPGSLCFENLTTLSKWHSLYPKGRAYATPLWANSLLAFTPDAGPTILSTGSVFACGPETRFVSFDFARRSSTLTSVYEVRYCSVSFRLSSYAIPSTTLEGRRIELTLTMYRSYPIVSANQSEQRNRFRGHVAVVNDGGCSQIGYLTRNAVVDAWVNPPGPSIDLQTVPNVVLSPSAPGYALEGPTVGSTVPFTLASRTTRSSSTGTARGLGNGSSTCVGVGMPYGTRLCYTDGTLSFNSDTVFVAPGITSSGPSTTNFVGTSMGYATNITPGRWAESYGAIGTTITNLVPGTYVHPFSMKYASKPFICSEAYDEPIRLYLWNETIPPESQTVPLDAVPVTDLSEVALTASATYARGNPFPGTGPIGLEGSSDLTYRTVGPGFPATLEIQLNAT